MSAQSHGQTLFTQLESAIEKSKSQYPKLIEKYSKSNFSLSNVADPSQIAFHPSFMNMIMLHNQNSVLKLGLKDSCAFVDLLSSELLYGPDKKLEYVLISFKDKRNELQTHALKVPAYLEQIGYPQCPQSKVLQQSFKPRNIRKILSTEKINYPKSQSECQQNYQAFINDPKSPYLCHISQMIQDLYQDEISLKNMKGTNYRDIKVLEKKVQEAKSYKKILSPRTLNYYQTMCNNAAHADFVCTQIFKQNFWSQFLQTKDIDPALQLYCGFEADQKVSTQKKQECINQLNANAENCLYQGDRFSSLFPKPNCMELSRALNRSRLIRNYNDCPYLVGQESLVTAGRILNHLTTTPTKDSYQDCSSNLTLPFIKFNEQYMADQLWDIQVCYDDKIQRKEVCYPTSFDQLKDSKYSLSRNIGKILARLRGFNDSEQTCKVINESEYRPTLLEFKTGCFIIKDPNKCNAIDCPFRVIYNDLAFDKFTLKNNFNLDLLPLKFTQENLAFINLIQRHLKVKTRQVLNISTFKSILKKHPKAIFMGVGCLENLLPQFYHMKTINQCQKISFIVDGIIEENNKFSMITRTSLDQIQAPRIIPWSYIFGALKNYQTHQPLNEWGFYAIY
ncbi:MAG: hypothetical protein CME62_08315 [Halobacteriovoraceae bacterium]|nr:hypothetical protein [Halobacteriovoraceae bacterium]|tara:strand:- start:11738 stop:13597 length:1860 start_codon:yes stop_codon:yes gene_type:complete